MEFLRKMKSREMIEMSLKTVMGVLLGLILIILMEGMIFGIYMNKINENEVNSYVDEQCVAYCEEVGDNEYKVYLNDTVYDSWQVHSTTMTEDQILNDGYGKVVFRAPNPFDVSISTTHYIVMVVFEVAVLGFYGWRFYKLNSEYKSFEKKYQKTGKIFA